MFIGSAGLQVSAIRTPNEKTKTLKNWLLGQKSVCENDRDSHKSSDLFAELYLKCIGLASRILKPVFTFCACLKKGICIFSYVQKWQWFRRGKKISAVRVIFSSGRMIALFLSDSIIRSAIYYLSSFLYEPNFFETMVRKEMNANDWSDNSSIVKEPATCTDATWICKKETAKALYCLWNELSSWKCKARYLHISSSG